MRTGRINGLDLFSGIGGNTLALRHLVKTVAYCETDKHAQSVLLSRMSDGSIESAPIWDDIRTLRGNQFDVSVDIIIGGFPCQDISLAGNGAGLDGKRSGLVFEIFRLIEELKPSFIFLENVSGIRTRGGERVVKELAGLGYDCRWDVLSASDVGAPHQRERWFLLGKSRSSRFETISLGYQSSQDLKERSDSDRFQELENTKNTEKHGDRMAYTNGDRHEPVLSIQQRGNSKAESAGSNQPLRGDWNAGWWSDEPCVDRVAYGVPLQLERTKRIGNAVVPAQALEAFERLIGFK